MLETITNLLQQLIAAAKAAPQTAFEIALFYSIVMFAFFVAAAIRRSRSAFVFGVLLAIGISAAFAAVKLIKAPAPAPKPPPAPVVKYIKVEVKAGSADEAVSLFTEKVFDKALGLKKLGFAKLPPYQREIITNRLLSIAEIVVQDTPEGVVASGRVEEDKLYALLAGLGYTRTGRRVYIQIINYSDAGLTEGEAEAIAEGIKRTSVFFLDNKLFSDVEHLKQELVGMEIKKGLSIADVTGTSTSISIVLKREK